MGDIALLQSEITPAERLHRDSLARFQALGDKAGTAYSLGKLGMVALLRGDNTQAWSLSRESLALFREIGDHRRIAESLEQIAVIYANEADYASAAALLSKAGGLRDRIGAPLSPALLLEQERMLTLIRAMLAEQEFADIWQDGRHTELQGVFTAIFDGEEAGPPFPILVR